MPYCKSCGEETPTGAIFCPKCGAMIKAAGGLVLANWGERLIAYIIDMAILGFVLGWFTLPGFSWMPHAWGATMPDWLPFVDFGFRNVIYFLYWMFMEHAYGQSLGKMAMKIEVTNLDGGRINLNQAAIQSIGKAFLLPLDCLLGWTMYPVKQQRLFNQLSDTVVLKRYH